MLEQLLNAIRSGGTFETAALAARLGTTPELVEAMLEHLERSGHLRPYLACGDACGGCGLRADCGKPGDAALAGSRVRLLQPADPLPESNRPSRGG